MKSPFSNSRRFNGPTPKPAPSCAFGLKSALSRPCKAVQGLLNRRVDAIFDDVRFSALANEAEPAREILIGLSNELAIDADGWALIPYGDHPNDRGLQRFTRKEADKMVGYFRNGWNRIKRAFVGMPILRGHPDMAETVRAEMTREKDASKRAALQSLINSIERRYPDKTVYGTVIDMESRDAGLGMKIVLTEEGAALVNEKGLTAFSPHWLAIDGEPVNGQPVKLPVFMVSLGLTDRPNIPGTSLVNDQPDTSPIFPTTPMNKQLLIQLLATLGVTLANEATDDLINAALTSAGSRAISLAARPEQTALVNEQSRVTELTGKLTAAEKLAQDNATALANAITARNEAVVNAAIVTGKITEANKAVWLGRLARDFDTESAALVNEKAIKTNPKTEDLSNTSPAIESGVKFKALVNERIEKTGEEWSVAWKAIKQTAEGKKLHAAMEANPAIA